jgi:biotin synthase-like enzyme
METCMNLGMVSRERAQQLAGAGLDYYNHSIDTSERYCGSIVGTRTFGDRLAPNPSEGNGHQLLRRLGMERTEAGTMVACDVTSEKVSSYAHDG